MRDKRICFLIASMLVFHYTFSQVERGFRVDGIFNVLWWEKDIKARASYIEMPVDLLYSPKAGSGNLLIAVGPYVGYGTGGKWKTGVQVVTGDIVTSELISKCSAPSGAGIRSGLKDSNSMFCSPILLGSLPILTGEIALSYRNLPRLSISDP
ncbi:MAG: hypothetical protein M9904_09065 [Chitinophagaceae bacterium]|nr:hypothetical protein [Chitinophagaceae bacterium]